MGAPAQGGRQKAPEGVPGIDELVAWTRDRLLDKAQELKLTRTSRLRKDQLAHAIREALVARSRSGEAAAAVTGRPAPAPPVATPGPAAEPEAQAQVDPTAASKLDLGPALPAEEPPKHIPWSYGLDRVTAAAVDPDRLFVYWEVTDPAIERARSALGKGGPGAWLDLRVYDTTGRLFDGTNAHSYFDHRVERGDRQWFFTIGKPTSTAVVEIGMRSSEGYFARIARSGRVDFPRKDPAPWREPEWMTVLATGEIRRGDGAAAHREPPAPPAPPDGAGVPAPGNPGAAAEWVVSEGGETVMRRLVEAGWERVEWQAVSGERWEELGRRIEWTEPAVATSWEAGPFSHPVAIDPPRRDAWEGGTLVQRVGDVTHVVSGPWQVVIRNLDARSEHRVHGRWEIFRWRLGAAGGDARAAWTNGAPGASERRLGASERRWMAGSELRLGGASELWRLGASEVAFRGASERRLRGASEQRLAGASEQRLAGASERRLAGAGERGVAGASERRLGGGSEERLAGSATPLPYPPASGSAPTAGE